jgi:hypothetical protein
VTGRPGALFTTDGDAFTPTELSRGPWDPRACHGGPVGALLARAVERAPGGDVDWLVARLTVELTRPVPLEPLTLATEVIRPGRKVSMVEAQLDRAADGVEVARVRALRIRRDELGIPEGTTRGEPPFGPAGVGALVPPGFEETDVLAFHKDGCEHRYVTGTFAEPGPAKVWIRLAAPVLEGEEPTGLQRVMAAADFGNGVSGALPYDEFVFINPDLTVHLLREPTGEWIGLDSRSHYAPGATGLAESALYDESGRVGRSVQSLFIDRR